jgi:hypothetical protein
MTVDKPGVYLDISEKDYHADPCVLPSLSSSIAKVLYDESPFHARYWHPRLNPQGVDDEKPDRPMDIGSAVHKFILGRGRDVEMVPFDDYRKNDARAAGAAIRVAGKIPLLQSDAAAVEVLNAAVVEQLADLGRGDIFTRCNTEVTLIWEDIGGIWCRARLDALPIDAGQMVHLTLPELKTTDGSADVDVWGSRAYFNNGNDIQAAFYRRGLFALLPELRTVNFEHVVMEQRPPNAVNILTASNQSSIEADRIVDTAMMVWAECMKTGQWPSYQGGVIETANWRSVKREEKNLALLKRMAEWQAP